MDIDLKAWPRAVTLNIYSRPVKSVKCTCVYKINHVVPEDTADKEAAPTVRSLAPPITALTLLLLADACSRSALYWLAALSLSASPFFRRECCTVHFITGPLYIDSWNISRIDEPLLERMKVSGMSLLTLL